MTEIGYAFSSEEHPPNDLVRYGQLAEQAGFTFSLISDHYHPWVTQQGNAPFVWSVIGALAQATKTMRLGTGVTCPTFRIHPAIIAQAAATSAAMMPGRFFLGVGSGEALNEHILGEHWPPAEVRLDMLAEAVEIIRDLWEGEEYSHWGEFFTVENATLFTLPDELPPLYIAAAGADSSDLAGKMGDGLISTVPKKELVQSFRQAGGQGKPTIGQLTVCYAESEERAKEIASKWWPNTVLSGALHADLPTTDHFDQAVKLVDPKDLARDIYLGPDKQTYLKAIQEMVDAGYSHVYIHQVGPEQEKFIRFCEREIIPEYR